MIKYKQFAALIVLTSTTLGLSTIASAELQSFEDNSNEDYYYCGYKNDHGQTVVPARYEFCGGFSEGMAYVGNSGRDQGLYDNYYVGYINESGKLVIPVHFDVENVYSNLLFRVYHEGLVATYKNGKYGYIDKAGKLVIPYQYESAGDFRNGRAVVCKNEKCGVINKSGNTLVSFKFHSLDDYSEDLAIFTTKPWHDGKYGFVNNTGNVVIDAKWDGAMPFSEGLAAVMVGDYENSKWGLIDKTGKVVVTPKYDLPYIEPMGDALDVDGGTYENGTIDMYDVNEEPYSITRYTLDRQGNVISKKTYPDWSDIENERHPEYPHN